MKQISKAVIQRLPRYHRYLGELKEFGIERISSYELSERMGVTASQIRQDLNNFGGFGQQGYGYNIEYLYDEIGNLLGLNAKHDMIIIGAGNLGQSIANYANFENRGFVFRAIFDIREELIGTFVRGIPVLHIDNLANFLQENQIEMAALTLPKVQAIGVAEILVQNGIKAIWNFAHTDLKVPADVLVENVHLSESLMRLSYRFENAKKENHKSDE